MAKVKRIIFLLMVITIVLLFAYTIFYFLFLDLFVNSWWFQSLKLESFFLAPDFLPLFFFHWRDCFFLQHISHTLLGGIALFRD